MPAHLEGGATEYQGSAFDGRYVYFAPVTTGKVARFDTFATALDEADAWSVVDLTRLKPTASEYVGAVFDGRWIDFVPFGGGTVARFDTTGLFLDAGAWSFVDLTAFDARAQGYFGAAYDGRFLYLSPYRRPDGVVHGFAARFDTTAPLGDASAWTFLDLTAVAPALLGMDGCAFDGVYIYYTPFDQAVGHVVARVDTRADFTTLASWETFDVGALDPRAIAFQGSVFDGQFVYFVPWDNGNGSKLARFDTRAPFAQPSSWTVFDLAGVDPNARAFVGGQFDGRFVYFAPYGYYADSGLVVRYDSTRAIDDLSGWSKFDLTTKSPSAVAFAGVGFDGRFIYLVPEGTGTFARFDAKRPPSLPPHLGSFM
ncbi:MAG: hypothetical protein JOZ69_17905 [Myxococcales bacterium]|nr:hypothetical protein [Myxococcales bacterium]